MSWCARHGRGRKSTARDQLYSFCRENERREHTGLGFSCGDGRGRGLLALVISPQLPLPVLGDEYVGEVKSVEVRAVNMELPLNADD